MMPSFFRATITRVRAPLVADAYGTADKERDWANATRTTITGCSVQPSSGSEYKLGREAVITTWRLYAPDGTDLLAGDRVIWDEDLYEVDGDPQRWPSATGQIDHVEVLLRRVVG
jgi:hypothetical protein